MTGKILLIDDDRAFARQLGRLLEAEKYQVTCLSDSASAVSTIKNDDFQLVLLDINMPSPDGIEILGQVIEMPENPEVIMLSGESSLQQAADSVKLGASDFLEKPPDIGRLLASVRSSLDKYRIKAENRSFRQGFIDRYAIIGQSVSIAELKRQIAMVAETGSRVLIWGETGTGKELVANQIHYRSRRAGKPLVKLNCAAIPADLAESELFGHKKGAFTGANTDKPGKFELADSGSLVLDEIAELPLGLQSKLLRVLETNEVEPLGGRKPVVVDVFTISISGKDLGAEVEKGNFRADLFYRINTIPVHVPPLRERKEDIPLLFDHFFNRLREKNNRFEKIYPPEINELLCAGDWPGNVRELKNYCERLFFLSGRYDVDIETARKLMAGEISFSDDSKPLKSSGKNLLTRTVDDFERNFLAVNLNQVEGNVAELARRLQVDRGNLYKKLKKHELL